MLELVVGDSRAMMICHWRDCMTAQELCATNMEAVVLLRRGLRGTMAWVWRKHVHKFRTCPWLLVVLGDARAPPRVKDAILEQWEASSACCLRPGMARNMKECGVDATALGTREWQSFVWRFACILRLTIADIEVRHPRNTRSGGGGHGNTSFAHIVANYVTT